jgi:putative transcriptional regulator
VESKAEHLTGSLLIAMPTLVDPNFFRTVVLIGTHSPTDGAFGLVVNRPLDVTLPQVLAELGSEADRTDLPAVLGGGPVEPSHGFVMFEEDDTSLPTSSALRLTDALVLSGNTEVLLRLASRGSTTRFHLFLGYAGWAPGQLEQEIEDNSWLVAPMSTELLFTTPFEDRWSAALSSIGVDPGTLVDFGSAQPS